MYNTALGEDYKLEDELAQAIQLVYDARNNGYKVGERVSGYARQMNLFPFDNGETVADYTNATIMMLADALNDGRSTWLKTVLQTYNKRAKDASIGQMDLFTGEVETKDEIIKKIFKELYNGQQTTNNGKENGRNERNKGKEQNAIASSSDTGSEEGTYTLSSKTSENGESFYQDNDGNIDLADINDASQNEVHAPLSKEVNEYGKPFVLSSKGLTNFGEVTADSGLPAAPIKLSIGENTKDVNGKNHGYGLLHIEASHGTQIRKAGFHSIEEFVENVAENYDTIREGSLIGKKQTYLLEVSDEHNNTLFVQLSRDGQYWNVNSAGIFREAYSRRKSKVASLPTIGSNPSTETAEVNRDHSMDAVATSGNSSTTSVDKVTESSEELQEKEDKFTPAPIEDGEDYVDYAARVAAVKAQHDAIKAAENATDTNPTDGQKKAGNYKKGHVQIGAFDISVEQPKGSVRRGKDADGKEWESKMNNTYGYIRGTEGVDGDHIDVFLSNDIDGWNGRKVFVVDQYNPDGTFDEHKVMLGFNDADDAKSNYLANYEKGWENEHRIEVSTTNLEDFEKWITSSKRKTKPFAEYKNVRIDEVQSASHQLPYSIEPATYTNKRGKATPMHLLTFDSDLTKEQTRAINEFAKEKISDGRFAKARGWRDRESGGWMFRSEEDAKKAADMVNDAKAVEDAQPLSVEDMAEATDHVKAKEIATKDKDLPQHDHEREDNEQIPSAEHNANEVQGTLSEKPKQKLQPKEVNMGSLFGELYKKGEAKLSDHTEEVEHESRQEQPKQEEKKTKSKWVDDEDAERFEELRKRLKAKLRGQLNMGVDPEIFAAGVEMSYLMLKHGARKFAEFSKQMLEALGEEVRPYLKSFYNGARDLPEMEDYEKEMTPYDEVREFDVKNFDKEGAKDLVETAEHIVREQEVEQEAKEATKKLKKKRNEERKEYNKQSAANTDQKDVEASKEQVTKPTSTTDFIRNKGRFMSEADIEGALGKIFVDKETGSEIKVGKFVSPHDVAIKINGDTSIILWPRLANTLNKENWQEVNNERVDAQEDTAKESGQDKKDISLQQQSTPDLFSGLSGEDSTLKEHKNERNDRSRESHSGIGTRREELSASDKVGTRASVQDTARDSQGQRRRPGISSTKLGAGPQYDVNKKYSNEEISDIVSSVAEIKDGKVAITGNVTDDIRTIARQYVSGGVAKDGRGVLDEYYTDGKIVDVVAALIAPILPKGRPLRVLEPSVGMGNFISAVPKSNTSKVVTFEINEATARIAKVLHPEIEVNVRSFETEFIDDDGNKKPVRSEYNVAIGNPPYGAHRGVYKGLGEESKISRYEDYFVKRSLDVLTDGGVLAMVLPSSWLGRQKQAKGYDVVRAYRLPSGAFAETKIGTDIVVLRKNESAKPTDVSHYFDVHPERVLGEVKERTGRFGRQEKYVDGNIDAALSAIQRDDAIDVTKELGLPHDIDTLNEVESAIEEGGSIAGGKKIVQAEEKEERTAKVKTSKKQSKNTNSHGIKRTLKKGGEVVPASVHFPTTFSESETEAFKATNYDGTIKNWRNHFEHVSYYDGSYMNDFYYAEGDIYARLAQLERDKDYIVNTHGQAQYDKQRSMLERVLPKPKGIDEISITPNTTFVHHLRIGGDKSLVEMFRDYIYNLPHGVFGESSAWEVSGYINNEQVYGNDKSHNQLVRDRRKKVGDALFKRFLKEELDESTRGIILNAFNREYNNTYRPDYSKVPMFSQLRKDFHGKPLKLTSVQLSGIGRSTVKGVGVLAHEVGFGKTLSGVLAMQEAMVRGTAKRPLIVVPNDNIMQQWLNTIEEAIPEATVNVLGNLGTKYDLTDFSVNDGEYSIVTYPGLKSICFSDNTYSKLADDFSYITDELKMHQSERDREKEKAKREELAGKMKKGTKKFYNFEDFGFDYLTFDEVHNANHIIGKVKLERNEYSDFRGQTQRSSDLGIKTWMAAQYIQAHNNGRNVLLLSATPFTNKPLEYYSILSLVANDMLKRRGFYKVDEFFKTFMEADNELEINAAGQPVRKKNVRRFRNNGLFQSLLGEYIDIKGEEDNPDLVRPERQNKEYKLPQNELTREAVDSVQDMLTDSNTVLLGLNLARQAAFSLYAVLGMPKDYKTFVENSPKIDAAIKLIEQNKKDRSDAGQIIYSEVCVDTFPLIKEYLVKESGYKDSEVRIITGATTNTERVKIQEAFNTGDVKVVIGSPAIKEGLNLQGNTTDMYILSLPWNFTQLRQIEGVAGDKATAGKTFASTICLRKTVPMSLCCNVCRQSRDCIMKR